MKKIGVIAKTQRTYPVEEVVDLIKWLKENKLDVFYDKDTANTIGLKSEQSRLDIISIVDTLIVLGGDGTFLSVARLVAGKAVPIMGVNMGSLGFLTEITWEEIYSVLKKVLEGNFETEERLLLDVKVLRGSEIIASHKALNDVVINKAS